MKQSKTMKTLCNPSTVSSFIKSQVGFTVDFVEVVFIRKGRKAFYDISIRVDGFSLILTADAYKLSDYINAQAL